MTSRETWEAGENEVNRKKRYFMSTVICNISIIVTSQSRGFKGKTKTWKKLNMSGSPIREFRTVLQFDSKQKKLFPVSRE